jgi:hypothetical protein
MATQPPPELPPTQPDAPGQPVQPETRPPEVFPPQPDVDLPDPGAHPPPNTG